MLKYDSATTRPTGVLARIFRSWTRDVLSTPGSREVT